MTIPRKSYLPAAAALLFVAAVAFLYFRFDPAVSPFPKCVFLKLTGWQCPGCGSQRAFHALLHGHVGAAWRYNGLLLLMLPYLGALLLAGGLKKKHPRFYAIMNRSEMVITVLAAVIVWFLVRNLFL